MSSLVLLASDHLDKGVLTVCELAPGAVAALTPGEGPSRNPKHQPNEDSLALVALPDGVAAFVADSHWGAFAGEELVRRAARSIAGRAPEILGGDDLGRWLLELDRALCECRSPEDCSETTLLAAIVRGSRLAFASIADSHLYVLRGPDARRLNTDLHVFAGRSEPLASMAGRGRAIVESGALDLEPGEIVLLASDGISTEDSGLGPDDLARVLGRPGPLAERVRSLAELARSAARGGGRDNLALVALDPSALAPGEARG